MQQKYIKFIVFSSFLLLLFACQREIDMKLPDYEPKLVIEGNIECGQPAFVMLSRSIPYFSNVNLDMLLNEVLISDINAKVFIESENGESEQLTYMITEDAPYFVAFVGKNVIGKEETRYKLRVEYDGKSYEAETFIPKTFELDSAGFDQSSEILNDTMATIRVLMTDAADETNYYAFFCKVRSKNLVDRLWVSMMPVAFDDRAFNGQQFNYEITRYGYSLLMRNLLDEQGQQNFSRLTFRPGDTVYLKHCQIDYHTYRYLSTAGGEAAFGSNPFMPPSPAISNFEGDDVLGHWSGLAAKIDTLVWHTER